MGYYLISGLPGTGKTTIENELKKLDYEVINTDEQWGYYGNIETEVPVDYPAHPTKEWFKTQGFIWSSKTVRPLLSHPREKPLFVCGGSRNESKFYDLFDKTFVLHVPDKVMRERLKARNDPNSSSELFISRMIEYNQGAYENAAKIGGIVIETTQPLEQVVKQILSNIHDIIK